MADRKPSVLASLTAQVMTTSDDKKKASRKLTPVEGDVVERPPQWPSDLNVSGQKKGFMSHEGMMMAAQDLRVKAATLIEIADALDAYSGTPTAPSIIEPVEVETKRKEAEADARIAAKAADPDTTAFKADFEAKQKAAQDAVYGTVAPAAWKCPIDNKYGVEKTSPSSGRTFIGCPDCKAFAR